MPKTAVGLFENPGAVDDVVHEIEALGFPRNEVRTLGEPVAFEVTGVMSFPRVDFEVDLTRALAGIGATDADARIYVDGLRRGGALVFATGSGEKVGSAAEIMKQHGAVDVEETTGGEPYLPSVDQESMSSTRDSPVQTGRVRQSGGGAYFVW